MKADDKDPHLFSSVKGQHLKGAAQRCSAQRSQGRRLACKPSKWRKSLHWFLLLECLATLHCLKCVCLGSGCIFNITLKLLLFFIMCCCYCFWEWASIKLPGYLSMTLNSNPGVSHQIVLFHLLEPKLFHDEPQSLKGTDWHFQQRHFTPNTSVKQSLKC